MGIYDREYTFKQRSAGLGGGLSVTLWLIIINVAVFLVMYGTTLGGAILTGGHFSTHKMTLQGGLQFWTVLTFQFLHGGFMHLFFNMFGLFIFGRMVEDYLGAKRYLAFYLVTGIFGAVMYLILNAIAQIPGIPRVPGLLFNDPTTPLIGASAGVFGVIMACAYIAPNAMIQLLLPPVSLRIKTFAYVYVGIALFSLLIGSGNAGGEAAHLGGAIAGYFFIRNAHLLRDFFDVFGDSRKPRGAEPGRRREPKPKGPRKPAENEVDRILAKVANQGLHSLTEAEKKILRRATEAERASDRTA